MAKVAGPKVRGNPTQFGSKNRRKQHRFQVTIYYHDGDIFSRTYTVHENTVAFAKPQNKSPAVKRARISQIS
jgi:hypothetical protein